MPNDLPAVRVDGDTATLPAPAWDDLIARLTLAEARLAAHHGSAYDTDCAVCETFVQL